MFFCFFNVSVALFWIEEGMQHDRSLVERLFLVDKVSLVVFVIDFLIQFVLASRKTHFMRRFTNIANVIVSLVMCLAWLGVRSPSGRLAHFNYVRITALMPSKELISALGRRYLSPTKLQVVRFALVILQLVVIAAGSFTLIESEYREICKENDCNYT